MSTFHVVVTRKDGTKQQVLVEAKDSSNIMRHLPPDFLRNDDVNVAIVSPSMLNEELTDEEQEGRNPMTDEEARETLISLGKGLTEEQAADCIEAFEHLVNSQAACMITDGIHENQQLLADAIQVVCEKADDANAVAENAAGYAHSVGENLVDAFDEYTGDQIIPSIAENAQTADDILRLVFELGKHLGVSDDKWKEIVAKVRAGAASSAKYDVDVGDNWERNRKSIAGNGSSNPVGNNVHEGHRQLGALLEARPGAGLFSPGIRFATSAPMLCEDVELDGELMDGPINEADDYNKRHSEAYGRALDRICASPYYKYSVTRK